MKTAAVGLFLSALIVSLFISQDAALAKKAAPRIHWYEVVNPSGKQQNWKSCPRIFGDKALKCRRIEASYVRKNIQKIEKYPSRFVDIIYGIDGHASCGTGLCTRRGRLSVPTARLNRPVIVGFFGDPHLRFAVSNSAGAGVGNSLQIYLNQDFDKRADFNLAQKILSSEIGN